MKRIVWDQPERVMRFVADSIDAAPFERYSAIGLESDGAIIAGVVFERALGATLLMHVASSGTRHWMTPAYMAACFGYAFTQDGANLVIGLVRADNVDAQRFDEHLGFKRRGQLPQACTDGTDMIVYGMLKSECRFIEGKYHAALLDDLRRAGLTR